MSNPRAYVHPLRILAVRRYSAYPARKLDYLFHCARRQRIILFSTPKCASSTLKRFVQLIAVDGDESKLPKDVHDKAHSPLCGFLALDEPLSVIFESNRYFRFCFVRNPYTRVLSCYLDKIAGRNRARFLPKLGFAPEREVTLMEFLQRLAGRKRLLHLNPHWAPQSFLIRPDRIHYHFIGRFEHLREHLHLLATTLGYEDLIANPDHVAVRPHRTDANERVSRYIGPKEADLIRRIYRDDFLTFGYSFDPRFSLA